jgi:hypothetical protein
LSLPNPKIVSNGPRKTFGRRNKKKLQLKRRDQMHSASGREVSHGAVARCRPAGTSACRRARAGSRAAIAKTKSGPGYPVLPLQSQVFLGVEVAAQYVQNTAPQTKSIESLASLEHYDDYHYS